MPSNLLFSFTFASLMFASSASPLLGNRTLKWQDCPKFSLIPPNRIECAFFEVPMDWDNPRSAGTVTLGIARLPAKDPGRRIGNLFYNPGGPGDQATLVLAEIDAGSARVHDDILERFDIIGVDLRGSGLSDPLKCNPDISDEYTTLPMYPDNEAEFSNLVKHNLAFRQSCIDLTGSPLFGYMDTISIVKDHEAVRQALGGEQISWLGQSYGTQLGSQYAELFPDAFRAMILDCSVSTSLTETSMFLEGAASVEATFRHFLELCAKQSTTLCPLAQRDRSPQEIWIQLLDRAAKSPIPALDCQAPDSQCVAAALNDDMIIEAAFQHLYTPYYDFPYLAQGIYNASYHNDASAFSTLSARAQKAYQVSYHYSNVAVACQDYPHNASSYVDVQYQRFIGESEAPLMRGYCPTLQFEDFCYGLPPPSRNPPHVISIPHIDTFPTVFMLANLYDPATPMAYSVNLREEIGKERAVLSTRIAAGHTTYFQPDAFNGEAVHAMNRYLLDLEVPEQGVVFHS